MTVELAQQAFDTFLAALHGGRYEEVEALLAPSAQVRVSDPDGYWEGRGEAARRRLVETLRADGGLRRRQVRSHLHPAGASFTTVMGHEAADGAINYCTLVLSIDATGRVSRLAYYRFPPWSSG